MKNVAFALLFLTSAVHAQTDSTGSDDDGGGGTMPVAMHRHSKSSVGHMYHVNNYVDMPIVAVFGGASVYLMSTTIYSKKATPESTILNLRKEDVPSYDRWTAGWHDANMDKVSYYPFYAVMPLPLLLLADKDMKSDRARIGLMYLEAYAIEGAIYSSAVYYANRFRPDVYDTALSLSYRTNGNFRNSFFAGHVAVTALSTFFIARVYGDYHPHTAFKWVLYGGATAATLGMSYMRLKAGKHFTSDIAVGIAVGTACGLLVPAIHRNSDYAKQKWSLSPDIFDGGGGFTFTYKL